MKDIFEQFNFDTSIYQKYKVGKQKLTNIFDMEVSNFYDKIDQWEKRKEEKQKSLDNIEGWLNFILVVSFFIAWLWLGGWIAKFFELEVVIAVIIAYFLWWFFLIVAHNYIEIVINNVIILFGNIITFGKYKKLEQSISRINGIILKAENGVEKSKREKGEYLEKIKNNVKTEVAPFEKEFCDYYERELEDFYNIKLFRKRSDSDDFIDDLFAFKILVEDLQKVNGIFLTQKIELRDYKIHIDKRESELESEVREIIDNAGIDSLAQDKADNKKVKKLHKFVETIERDIKKEKHEDEPVEQKYKLPQKVDWQKVNIKNQKTGLKGEEIVMGLEKEFLQSIGRDDLAQSVRHVSVVDGDGAGYDIKSFFENGAEKYIEVKSTVNSIGAQYFISSNELAFLRENKENYFIYRVSLKDNEEVTLQVISGEDFLAEYTLNPVQYSVKSKA